MKQIPDQIISGQLPPDPDFNDFKNEVQNLITSTGQTLTSGNTTQLSKSISDYSGAVNFYLDTGAADAYVLNVTGSFLGVSAYRNGLEVRFRPANTNTGASTVNVSSLGVQNIVRADGATALSAGDLSNSYDAILRYDGTNFRLVSYGFLEIAKIAPDQVDTDIIQIKTASGDLIFNNELGNMLAKFRGGVDPRFYSVQFGDELAALSGIGTVDFVVSEGSAVGLNNQTQLILVSGMSGGATNEDSALYLVGNTSIGETLTQVAIATNVIVHTLAFQSTSGAPNYQKTYRLTGLNATGDLRVIRINIF